MNAVVIILELALLFRIVIPQMQIDPAPLLSWKTEGDMFHGSVQLASAAAKAKSPDRIINDSLGAAVTAQAAIVYDPASETILWEKNPDEKRALASITKLASLQVIADNFPQLDSPIEITKEDYISLGYNNFIIGEKVMPDDLFAAALIASDNTAVRALARATGLSQKDFVSAMNAFARHLGLKVTTFVDETGLSQDNVSTAREAIQLARSAFSQKNLRDLSAKRMYSFTSSTGQKHSIRTTDQLIGSTLLTVRAGKTGYVTESGYNFIAEVTDGKHPLLIIALGSGSNADRFQDVKMLAYWTWKNFTWSD